MCYCPLRLRIDRRSRGRAIREAPFVKPKKRTTDPGKSETEWPRDQPSSREQSAISTYLAPRTTDAAPRLKVLEDGNVRTISTDHPNGAIGHALLMEALGTADTDFLDGLVQQLVAIGSDREVNKG